MHSDFASSFSHGSFQQRKSKKINLLNLSSCIAEFSEWNTFFAARAQPANQPANEPAPSQVDATIRYINWYSLSGHNDGDDGRWSL